VTERFGQDPNQGLIATAAAIAFIAVSPAFSGPAEDAEWDYAGWLAVLKAAQQQVDHQVHHGHVIYRTNQGAR
jgi:hypothetical protein